MKGQARYASLERPKATLAIDPGVSGGLAYCLNDFLEARPMPDTEGDILTLLKSWEPGRAIIEAQAYVGGRGCRVSPATMGKFGRNYGFLMGCLMALGFSVEEVRPQKWQKDLSLGGRKEAGGKAPFKRKAKAMAQRLFPSLTVTLKTADALLILEWSRRANAKN